MGGERRRGGDGQCLLVELHLAALKHRLEVVRQMLLVPLQQAAVRKVAVKDLAQKRDSAVGSERIGFDRLQVRGARRPAH